MLRHHCFLGLFSMALLAAMPLTSAAQGYPTKAVRIVVPFPPGGGSDIIARMVADKLKDSWGQSVIVDNRPGASGIIGTDYVARAPADGHTLLLAFSNYTTTPAFHRDLPFHPIKDFAPITLIVFVPTMVLVTPELGARSIRELVQLAKQSPGKINFGSSGPGSLTHLMGELLNSTAGIDVTHVPYKGIAPALVAQLGGEVQINFTSVVSAGAYLKSGRLQAIAVASRQRTAQSPDTPTVDESGVPGYEAAAWYGLLAPAGTPRPIVEKIQGEVARLLAVREFGDRLAAQGGELAGTTPEAFAQQIREEIEKWSRLVAERKLNAQ